MSKSEPMPCLLCVFLSEITENTFCRKMSAPIFQGEVECHSCRSREKEERGEERRAVQEEVTFSDVLEQYELGLLTCKRFSKQLS